jgi:hypothetical protein
VSMAPSLRTVRSMALSRVNAPFLAENAPRCAGLRKTTKGGGWRHAPCSLEAWKDAALLPKGVWLPSVFERLR